ncbi:hypothetical protein QQY66_06995 [Streptomyces sp. DG2A-72]|uniref:hypothetical protein n=1 Tax=Streptomyces sp. DG2A-72 TaxID=3051386 RepID=UPI00265BCF73|nr:hypothetical protein [Streptomyces sp. DG2A-72]MDO0931435.1 hypothetical protein [Streptomyces sp. DG2A-72]
MIARIGPLRQRVAVRALLSGPVTLVVATCASDLVPPSGRRRRSASAPTAPTRSPSSSRAWTARALRQQRRTLWP